jgi:hypothetical protein
MCEAKTIFQIYGESLCHDQRTAKVLRAFAPHCFDGTEIHHIVRQELRGLEHSDAANSIMRAIEAEYRDCIQRDVVLELVGKFLDDFDGDTR